MDAEYIKMCEAAEEVQTHRHAPAGLRVNQENDTNFGFEEGDFYYDPKIDEVRVYAFENFSRCCGNEEYEEEKRAIWLPRQDQLQDLIPFEEEDDTGDKFLSDWVTKYNSFGLTEAFNIFIDKTDYPEKFSMEQLWLCFAMEQKYNKTWNGETCL